MNKVEAVSKNQITTVKRSFLDSDNAVNLMYIPAFILFIIFVLYPLIEGVRISFTDWNGFSQSYDYIGIKNYLYMLTDKNMLIAFINTLIYGFGSTFFQQILGLGYAILLNNYFKGRDFARTLIYLPVLIAPIIMGYMWYFLFQYSNGALNDVLKLFGMQPIDWLAKGNVAVWIIVLVNTLQFCGISMVIYLAGLQTIPKMYYEASEIDGANAWQQFLHITLPLLKPSIVTSITINLIGGLKLFDAIKALTNGGPGYASHSISTLLSYTYFNNQSAGYASAMGIILFIFIILISLLSQILFNRKEVDY
ncbi:MAG: raffinose/stachyose/melibiose transport system permease protein [Fusobacteriaceae bacterium]|jgi:raffinose/stachyose/melibiose transport system permease protein|nr:binding-protein-dependent transport system inner rane component [Fusobacteriales bacterium]MDN5305198.1 raffinose/stachyose/melibiose transport system permease protein [Fusobacteriaceae bacterium]